MFNFGFGNDNDDFGFGGNDPFGGGHGDDGKTAGPKHKDNKLYEILGLPPTATIDEIKKAFKKKALKMHPDKGGDPEKFKELSEAYEILGNPEKKDLYDRYGMEGVKNGGQSEGFDIFDHLFGFGGGSKKEKGPKKGKSSLKEVKVTLEEVYQGKLLKIPHTRKRICTSCGGKGGRVEKVCTQCKGKGQIEKLIMLGPGMYSHSRSYCPTCKGEGKSIEEKDKCKDCKGNKVVEAKTTVEVSLEPGVPHDHDYIVYGESDEYPGMTAGDMYVRIFIEPHKELTRKGADLFYEKKITIMEALTGFNFSIQHLDNDVLIVSTIPGEVICPNQVKVVKGKGMPFYKDEMSHGNLVIKFIIDFPQPQEIDEKLCEELKKILPGSKELILKKESKIEYLDEFDEKFMNTNPEGGHKEGDEEEEDFPRKGQRVQCAQQ